MDGLRKMATLAMFNNVKHLTGHLTGLRMATASARAALLGAHPSVIAAALLRIGAAITLTITGGLALISGQAYDGQLLRDLLEPPPGCAMPCWEGIQPAVTPLDDALAILAAHPWVEDYYVTPGKVSWWWNGQQPPVLDDTGRAFHGRMEYATIDGVPVITSIVLTTTIPLGEVRLTLGEPGAVRLYTVRPSDASNETPRRAGIVYLETDYSPVLPDLYVFNTYNCPIRVDRFWHTHSYIAYGLPALTFEGELFELEGSRLPSWFFRDQAPGCGA
ncbi:MAG: hypothetical protein SNJ59_04000 [Aggregatilineales bacterium]